jgi:Tfp pilus assembly protein PilX
MQSHRLYFTEGFALPVALLVLLMLSALSVAMMLVVTSETRIHTIDA